MLNSKKEGQKNKRKKKKIRAAQDEKPEAALRCEGNVKTTIVPHEGLIWNGRRIGKVEKQRRQRSISKDSIRK